MTNNTQKGKIIAISPNDINVQFVPNYNKNEIKVTVPEPEIGHIIPLKLFLVEQYNKEFCGVFEVSTLFFNENIRRDILDEFYRDDVQFDIYIRQRQSIDIEGPKILKEYKNCHLYRQQLAIPEISLTTTFRYYFANTPEPWEISNDRINEMRPPNQYIYDYAVSKAIKNLQYPLDDVCKAIKTVTGSIEASPKFQTVTAKEYLKIIQEEGSQ